MILDCKVESKKNVEGIYATKKDIAEAVKNIKKEFGIREVNQSQASFN